MRVRDLLVRLAWAGGVYAAVLAAMLLCVGLALLGPLGVLDPEMIGAALATSLPGALLSVVVLALLGSVKRRPWIASAALGGVVTRVAGANRGNARDDAGVIARVDSIPDPDAFFDPTGLVVAGAFVTFGLVGFLAGAIVARRGGEWPPSRASEGDDAVGRSRGSRRMNRQNAFLRGRHRRDRGHDEPDGDRLA